ncbi:hypothetical protein DFH09DRAFT_1347663 [Mycena vulgaris]|nr:hypothetical protein DFH09DRAFT_1347663 [Mycena vulgaris]
MSSRNFASHERAMTHLQGSETLPAADMPWRDLVWGLIGNKFAKSAIHQDTCATQFEVVVGSKLMALGFLRDASKGRGPGEWGSRHALDDWDSRSSNIHICRYMGASTQHLVIGLEDAAVLGQHGHCATAIASSVHVIFHITVTEGISTNAEDNTAKWLLLRIYFFQAHHLTQDHRLAHVYDLTDTRDVWQLLTLQSFAILYLALNTAQYAPFKVGRWGHAILLPQARCAEVEAAWRGAARLTAHVNEHYRFSTTDPWYKSWSDVVEASRRFYPAAIRQELTHISLSRRGWYIWLAASLGTKTRGTGSMASEAPSRGDPDRELAGFMTNKPLTKLFDQKLASAVPFSYFLPWTEATFPCTILPNDTMDNL